MARRPRGLSPWQCFPSWQHEIVPYGRRPRGGEHLLRESSLPGSFSGELDSVDVGEGSGVICVFNQPQTGSRTKHAWKTLICSKRPRNARPHTPALFLAVFVLFCSWDKMCEGSTPPRVLPLPCAAVGVPAAHDRVFLGVQQGQ